MNTIDDPITPPPGGHDPAPPPPPPAATEPIIGGVCATLADRLGIDALWIRIAFVVLAVGSGLGLFAYLGLWLALVAGRERGSRLLVSMGMVILLFTLLGAVPLTLSVPRILGGTVFSPLGLPFVALLAGVAIALWQPRSPRSGESSSWPSPRVPTAPGVPAVAADTAGSGWASSGSVPPTTPAPAPRDPSILGPLTLGAAFLVVALGALVDQANGGRLHPEQWLGAGAVVCGVGLLVGTVRGRARWLVVPALALGSLGLLGGHMARLGIGTADLVGDVHVFPDPGPGGEVVSERLGLGRLVIHADEVSFRDDGPPSVVDARVGVGTVDVWVPDGLRVHVETRSPTRVRGVGVRRVGDHFEVGPDGPPQLIVRAQVGIGQVRVRQGWSTPPDLAPELDVPPAEGLVDLGSLIGVTEGVAMTADGVFVLGDGEAVVDVNDTMLVGDWWEESPSVIVISTNWGEFRLLPRSLLLTPYGDVLDLRALREAQASQTPSTTDTVPPDTVPPETVPTATSEEG